MVVVDVYHFRLLDALIDLVLFQHQHQHHDGVDTCGDDAGMFTILMPALASDVDKDINVSIRH